MQKSIEFKIIKKNNPISNRDSKNGSNNLLQNNNLYDTTFSSQVKKNPTKNAVIFQDKKLSYKEFNAITNAVAHYILSLGARNGECIGVRMQRSMEMLIAVHSIIKAGCTYVPINFEDPQIRINEIVDNCEINTVLTQGDLFDDGFKFKQICLDKEIKNITSKFSKAYIDVALNDDDIAYIIHTSGSTGKPKGIAIEYKSLIHRILYLQKKFDISDKDVFLLKTPYTFDVSIYELFIPLLTGGTLVIAEEGKHKDQKYLYDIINKEQVTIVQFVPSMLELFLLENRSEDLPNLRYVICNGEELRYLTVKKFSTMFKNTKLLNFYGPAEATVHVCEYDCRTQRNDEKIPIGKPIDGVDFYILNKDHIETKVDEIGELFIGGVGLSTGYVNNTELSNKSFCNINISGNTKRLYKTGDLVKKLSDGNFQYIGRNDFQYKINGIRIELGEIEGTINELEEISQVAVLAIENSNNGHTLVAFYKAISILNTEDVKQYIADRLPKHMLPSRFLQVEEMPLNTSGKLDRKALKNIYPMHNEHARNITLPATKLQQQIFECYKEVLKKDNIDINDSFFDIGGDSLLSMHLSITLEIKLSTKIDTELIYQYNTINKLAEHLSELNI